MNILLLGEYSGFFVNLKQGLIELGHNVDLSSKGDGFKKTSKSDIFMPGGAENKVNRVIEKITFPIIKINQYFDYDVVQLINSNIFGGLSINYNSLILKRISRRSEKFFLSSCGTDYFVYNVREKLRYNPFESTIKIDTNGYNEYIQKKYYRNNVDIINLVDGIIPTLYTYAEAYRENPKLLNTIQFPVDIHNIKFIPQKIQNDRLKIFHGLNRDGFKGTKYIREAMEKLKEDYPNDVEILIDGKMPLNKYLKVLEETNVVVDQALSYEYGMNAVYSMAMGKVVLSGNEPECQKEFGRTDIPIINIEPSVDDIYNKLEKIVLNKKSVIEIGEKSRLFVEDFHHHVKVAQQYIDTWNSVEVKK
jgi:glycosyltransferase involved in cell wall biosynthesis